MSSDYERISRENLEEYGRNRKGWRRPLLADRYADPMHFMLELLQNAEDALGRRDDGAGPRGVKFELADGAVRFRHHGQPFDTQDVEGVCGIGETTKAEDLTAIGHFGIGFKSVYAITDRPEVHSGDEHFAIEDDVCPVAAQEIGLEQGETVIVLPLRENDESRLDAAFGRLGPRTLLFLRHITAIDWAVEGGRSGYYRRDDRGVDASARRVTLRSQTHGEGEPAEETWLVLSRDVQRGGRPAGRVELAFNLATGESGNEVVEAIKDSCFAAFFPTEIDAPVGMLVQGPYRTTSSRENIPPADEWNRRLVAETAELLVEALRYLRDHGLLGVHVYEALPLERPQPDAETRFAPYVGSALFEAVHRAIENEPLLPAHSRGGGESWIPASQSYLGTPELRNLVSRQQLAELWSDGEQAAWLDGDIDERRTPALHEYLVWEQDIRNLTPADLVYAIRLDEPFLQSQPDSWMRRLYAFLLDHGPRSRYSYMGVPLIRLDDGTHVAPAPGSTPVAYLPTDPPSKFLNTVRAAVCSSQKARAFLESLGLQQPDRVDELIRNVLPRYRKQEDVTVRKYADDLREIAEVYRAATGESRQRLVEALRETPFVRAVDAGTGEVTFERPRDVYARRLLDLFEGVPSVLIAVPLPRGVPATDADRLFAACGVTPTLGPVFMYDELGQWSDHPRFLRMELADLRRQASGGDDGINWQRGSSINDSMLRGLDGLIKRLPELPSEDARRRAKLLWDALRATAQGAFSGQYRWFRYSERSVEFDSASVDLLNRSAWVPGGNGDLQRPLLVSLDDLGWQRNAFLESKIKFRPPVLDTLAEEAGLDRSDIDLVREARERGMSNAEMRAKLGLAEPPPASPDDAGEDTGDEHAEDTADAPAPPGRVPTPQPPAEPAPSTEAAPRVEPAPTEGGRRAFRSYIEVREEAGDGAPDPDGLGHEERMALEEAAIALIRERGPSLRPTAAGNAGYDLYEAGGAGEIVRWVEVKSMRGGWDAGPVGLTHTQFGLAREKGGAYWLYVVEYAGDAERHIVRVRDPAGRDSEYLFDDGWREAAEPEPPPR